MNDQKTFCDAAFSRQSQTALIRRADDIFVGTTGIRLQRVVWKAGCDLLPKRQRAVFAVFAVDFGNLLFKDTGFRPDLDICRRRQIYKIDQGQKQQQSQKVCTPYESEDA
ncbi:MAG: hypothetical protein U1B82_06715 [Cypionkella sp.]|nr:hypothetical protein [Cypionkella sp.]